MPRGSGQAYVYFVLDESSGLVKIGQCHGDVYARIRAGQSFNPNPIRLLGVIIADGETEKRVHRIFSSDRVIREWFRYSDALREFIDNSKAFLPTPPTIRATCSICHRQAVKNTGRCRSCRAA